MFTKYWVLHKAATPSGYNCTDKYWKRLPIPWHNAGLPGTFANEEGNAPAMNGWKHKLPTDRPQERQQLLTPECFSARALTWLHSWPPVFLSDGQHWQMDRWGLQFPWERLSWLLHKKTQNPNLSLSGRVSCTPLQQKKIQGGGKKTFTRLINHTITHLSL